MVGKNRLANRRKVPNQTPERTRFSSGCAVVGTRTPGWAPRPCARRRSAPGSQRSQPHHLSNGLDNKRRALRKSGGRGNSKSPKSLCARRCVLFSPPSTFYEFLEVDPRADVKEVAQRHRSAYALCTQIQVQVSTHSASPLLSKQPE